MNYLKYIEHSAENLQFYLWFRDYSARFESLPRSEQALSPQWTQAQAEAEAAGNTSANKPSKNVNPQIAEVLEGTDFADGRAKTTADPFNTPDETPSLEEKRDTFSEYGSSNGDMKTMVSSVAARSVADSAFDDAGMKWKPCMSHLKRPAATYHR